MTYGQTALQFALDELGNGEEGKNNRGPHIERWGGRPGAAWCATFLSYCLKQASLAQPGRIPVKFSSGAHRLCDYILEHPKGMRLERVQDIQPGDISDYKRGLTSTYGHVGICAMVTSTGYINIEGNVGPFPAVVCPVFHSFKEKAWIRTVRIS